MKDPLGLPSEVEMVNLQSQLSIAKQTTKDRVGLLIVGDLLNEAVALLGIRVRYDNLATRTDAVGLAFYASTSGSFTDERVERLESLHKQTYRWIARIISQFDALGLDAPGVVKCAGSASISVSASADGRVQRS
ncbi:MAG: hypothetical protein L0H54_05620 [Alcaligenaceae bacterium]|nr:hypothetical protein [Alcaligenaceae bacterium]